jgi:simple sugar transport system permease protein
MNRPSCVPSLLAAGAALVGAFAVSSLVLVLTGTNAGGAYAAMWRYGTRPESVVSIINRAIPLYLAGLSVAIGLHRGLFNIGVEGQYRLAAVAAATLGAALALPPVVHAVLILLVAVATGAAWAGLAAVLRVTRGVHEVISTIMLNFVATGMVAYLLATSAGGTGLSVGTRLIPPSGRVPSLDPILQGLGINLPEGVRLHGFVVVAVVAGVGFHLLVRRSRFGFDIRAMRENALAARAGGVDPGRTTVQVMLLSGGLAGLVGMAPLLGTSYRFSVDFPTGLGFTGIAVALLGRGHPLGIAGASLLFGFLERSAQILDLRGVPRETVVILQGAILLFSLVGYEIGHRMARAHAASASRPGTGVERAEGA